MIVDKVSSGSGFNPFAGNSIEKVLPATEPQTEILISCIVGGNDASLAYNQSISLSFTGPLNENILRDSLQELLNRNEALRSSFNAEGTQMFIYSSQPLDLFYQDISSSSAAQQNAITDAYNRKDASTTFDLINGPLIRFALFKKAADQFLLTISVHHVICDGWTWGIMFEQLSAAYNSKLKKEPLSDHPLLFSDYVKKVIAFSDTKEYAQIEKYWLDQYKNNIPVFEVPPDFPRPQLRTYRSDGYNYTLSNDLADAVKRTGAKHGCSFVNTLMSVFEILLYKYTGNNDVVIGLPTTGQTATEMHYLVGHCVNFLSLRSHPDDELSFVEYLKIRKSKTLMDYEHQQFTYGALLKKLNIKRDAARIPLTPVSFNVSFGMNMHVSFEGIEFEIIYNPRVSETFELNLNITEGKNGYVFRWAYNTQLYDGATVRGLMQKYLRLLQQIVENPDQKIRDLYIEDQPAIVQKPEDRSNTDRQLPDTTAIGLFEEAALRYPDHIALDFRSEKFTYRQLNEWANRYANFLWTKGIKKGDIVGIVLERTPQVIIAMLAVLKCGGAYLPIDPGFPEDRINFMLEDSEARFVLVNNIFAGKLNPAARLIVIENIEQELQQADTANIDISIPGGDLAYLLYTSGSTGKPKGVMVSHRNLLNFLLGMKDIFRTGVHTRLLSVTTISFDIAGLEIYLPLISGGQLVLADKDATKDSKALIELLRTAQIGIMQATPATYKLMLQEEWPENPSLTLLCGGEALSKTVAEALLQKCGRLFNMYGPTETTIWSTVKEITAADELITIGRPIQNTSVYILDEHHTVLPPGTEGEIFIGGEGVALGYYKRPELTAERFIPDLFSDKEGARLYNTGDLGKYLPGGELVCLGRSDNQAKIRGYRIELEEIEHYISKIEGIKDAVVKVEGADGLDPRLIGYVIPSDMATLNGGAVTRNEIISWRKELGRVLPDYMVPNGWVKLKEFPLTPNKKVDRKALQYKEGRNERQDPASSSEELAALTADIKNIWENEIGVKGIEPGDNFFELGGHSLLAVRVIRKLEAQTGLGLDLTTVFRFPVLKDLAAECNRVRAGKITETDNTEERQWYVDSPDTVAPDSFASTEPQRDIWQACIIGGPQANIAYNLAHAEYQEGALDINVLKQSLQDLMSRYELLHARFGTDGDMIYLDPRAALPFCFEDISAMKPELQQSFIKDFLQKRREEPFDLEKDILFRVDVLKLNNEQHVFSLVIHHLICDGGSFDTIIKDLGQIYNAYKTGKAPELDQVVRFSTYAARERERYQKEAYKKDIGYWASKFENEVPVLDLPVDYPYPSEKTYKSNINYFSVNKEDTVAIEQFASRFNSTTTILLRTIFDILIYKYTGQSDFVVGLPVRDHMHAAGFSIMGHSVNMLPVRSKVEAALPFREFLKQRNDVMITDYEHQQVTFGSLVKEIKIKRNAIRNTLVSVSFGSQMEKSANTLEFAGIRHEAIAAREGYSNLELSIDTFKKDGTLHFQVFYNSGLLKPATITQLMDRFLYIQRQVVANPDQTIADLKLEEEKQTLQRLQDWNGNTVKLTDASVMDLVNKSIEQYPDRVAIKFNNEPDLTYRELNDEVNRLSSSLLQAGIRKGDRIGIALSRGPWLPVALLATLKCGGVYVPIDVQLPEPRIRFMLNDAGVKAVITSEAVQDKVKDHPNKILIEQCAPAGMLAPPMVELDQSDSAYVLYTSGSTGLPKGVRVTHGNLVNLLTGMQSMFRTDETLRLLSVTTISFDIVGVEMYLPLISGGQLILTTEEQSKNGVALLRLQEAHQVNFFQATPATYKMMLESGWEKKTEGVMITCGEPLTQFLADAVLPRCASFYNMYGPTETTIYSTGTKITEDDTVITIGKPIQNTQVYIVDRDGNLLPPNITGEICIAGDGVTLGYHDRSDLTREKFVEDRFGQGGGKMFRTGDLGKFTDNGDIICLGRKDDQVKLRGYRIELGEIDWQIKELPEVKDVITLLREDRPGDQRLVSYVVAKQSGSKDAEQMKKELREALHGKLPDYMIPSVFVLLEALPLTTNGKVDKKQLPVPVVQQKAKTGANAPLTPADRQIKAIWEEELGLTDLSLDDDFFELGGNSLIAIKIMSRIGEVTGNNIPISALFEHSTLNAIIKLLNEEQKVASNRSLVPIKTTGTKPPIYLVHGGALNILLYKQLEAFVDADQPLYGLQAMGLNGDLSGLGSIEEIAGCYLAEMMKQNPDGPYIIVGYSYGGILAYEMARQLMAMGKEISTLGILDTNVSDRDLSEHTVIRAFQKGLRQLKKATHISKLFAKRPKEVVEYQKLIWNRKFNKRSKENKAYQIYDYPLEVILAYEDAYNRYILKPLDVEVHLFRVMKRIYFVDDFDYLGWKKYAKKGVVIHDVPGDHKTFLMPPNNKELMQLIVQSIK